MRHAVVLVSGGLDSATVLAMAQQARFETHALTIDYGQRHRAELAAADRVARAAGASSHRVVKADLASFGGSALTDPGIEVPKSRSPSRIAQAGIPATYVPARNTVMLSMALSLAEVLEARDVFCGVNAVDYSGYPDCRPEFVMAFEDLANVATRAGVEGRRFRIQAPLIKMSKADIIRVATQLEVDLSLTVSCYDPDDSGAACGECDACVLRREGFAVAGISDVTRYR